MALKHCCFNTPVFSYQTLMLKYVSTRLRNHYSNCWHIGFLTICVREKNVRNVVWQIISFLFSRKFGCFDKSAWRVLQLFIGLINISCQFDLCRIEVFSLQINWPIKFDIWSWREDLKSRILLSDLLLYWLHLRLGWQLLKLFAFKLFKKL